jgi:hypothetical protein
MDRFTPAIAAGSVNVISVAAIREGFGDRWPRKSDQVEAFIQRSFVRVAGPGVLVTALNEVEFVSILPDSAVVGYGLASRSLTLAAWAAGFTHLSGPAVQQTQDRPRAMRWEPTDLYRPFLPALAAAPSAPSARCPSA